MTNTTFDVLRSIIATDHAIDPATINPETPLADLSIDSLAVIELIFTLEDRFSVVAEDVPADFPNLGSVADYIDGLIAQRDAASSADGAAQS